MKSVKVYAVGKIKEKNIQGLIDEYQKRLKVFAKIELIELKDKGIEKDSLEISNLCDNNTYILDELGANYSSIAFSDLIDKNENIKFIIGGADGITKEAKSKAKLIALSKMTFTHEMARLILIEQIYRAFMIINNRSYHK
ncbi:MAG: 23S rRNA (pseudouridine(1915)-N(3))-methyltransferase RlmH [Candidatus Nanoarchaeia archaeon]|nr:23S rRNA (pseudouridine(1915)-N(3))-methyltransferase RlmH [Candidatus Nanoarchaeia archaeon]